MFQGHGHIKRFQESDLFSSTFLGPEFSVRNFRVLKDFSQAPYEP